MYSLNAIGPTVEVFLNRPRTLVVFIFSGIIGVIFSFAFTPSPSVGASGAIFGLLGALGTFLFLNRALLGAAGRAYLRQIIFIALLNLGLGLSPNIDNWGHLGGLVAGAAITWFIGPQLEQILLDDQHPAKTIDKRPWSEVRTRVFLLAAGVFLLAYLTMLYPSLS
jgi:membrane associated rhomboid family serine protease